MQIASIILFKDETHSRILDFRTGCVNIITGESKSGKTALIDIVDYCLGSKECNIAHGVIRNNVRWFSIIVVFNSKDYYFIARENPSFKNVDTNSEAFLEKIASRDKIPSYENIIANTNIEAIKSLFSNKLGITANLQISESNSKEPLVVTFRHARLFCFLPQTVIGQSKFLFYKQEDSFVMQAIKLSLPYLLGAINDDNLIVEKNITLKKRELYKLMREKAEDESIEAEGKSLAFTLIDEAKQLGILDPSLFANNMQDALEILNSIKDWEYKRPEQNYTKHFENDSTLKQLINSRMDLKDRLSNLEDSIEASSAYLKEAKLFKEELSQQKSRLESVNLFKNNDVLSTCPLCHNKLNTNIPSIDSIRKSLSIVETSLENTEKETPELINYINKLNTKRNDIITDIENNEQSINNLYKESRNAQRLRDLNIRRGKTLGKISLFLDSIKDVKKNDIEQRIKTLKDEIEVLSSNVDHELVKEKMDSILNKINVFMSTWGKKLDIEHKDSDTRFNPYKLTLTADTDNGPIPLSQMGSAANWVNYHLLLLISLHHYFIRAKRPIPHFLMIDQPTQPYFPSQNNSDSIIEIDPDNKAVNEIFEFIFEVTKNLFPHLQIIITDHAHLRTDNFNKCIIEEWRNGKKLIPEDWYSIK